MYNYYNLLLNGTAGNNTIGNRSYLMGASLRGSIEMGHAFVALNNDYSTDCLFRESVVSPKDPYYFFSSSENSVANTTPSFNQAF